MKQSGRSSRVRPARSSSRSPEAALVAVLAVGASLRGIFNDFVYDDIPIIQDNARVHQFDVAHVREIFANAYWPPPFVEQLYRPLTLVGLVHFPVHVIVTLGSIFDGPVKANAPFAIGIAFATTAFILLHLKFDCAVPYGAIALPPALTVKKPPDSPQPPRLPSV